MDKKTERLGRDKVLKKLATLLGPLGFMRTKSTFFTRVRSYWVEFGHLHKFSFGPYFRIHLGIRILADTEESLPLNGPDSDQIPNRLYFLGNQRKYTFVYGASPTSIEQCTKDISKFWIKVAEPWFKKWQDPQKLIESNKSPLSPIEKEILMNAIEHGLNDNTVEVTKKLLGLH